jgi:antitoxin component YwqK of YwqJK toxin-antitoxin module
MVLTKPTVFDLRGAEMSTSARSFERFWSHLVLGLLLVAGCEAKTELTPCGGSGYLVWRPVNDGTEVFCRLATKLAHGEYRFEDTSGITVVTGSFDQGRADGEWTWWYSGGLGVERRGNYLIGDANGLWEGFDENGTKRWEHHFDRGLGCGQWMDWDEQGELINTTEYAACDSTGVGPTPEGVNMAPTDVEPSWDGIMCPAGTGMDPSTVNQDARWCLDYGGAKSGPFLRFYPGQVQVKEAGQHAQGKRTGTWATWSQEGYLLSMGEYVDGERNGEWWFWRGDGTPVETGVYAAGQRSGKWTAWYATCVKEWEGSFASGLKDGVWSTWWPTGILQDRSTWRNAVLEGAGESFWQNGNPKEKGGYVDGRRDGLCEGFWPTGKRYWEGSFTRGWRDGKWTWWTKSGGQDMEGTYDMQTPVGDWTLWAVDEATGLVLKGTGPFDGGRRNGIWRWRWEQAGTLESEILYRDDLREGPWVSLWPDGVKRIDGYFIAGVGEFQWTYYHQNAQMSLQESYHQGVASGLSTAWWPDGSRKWEGNYAEGRKKGVWIYWDEQGNETTETFDEGGYPK